MRICLTQDNITFFHFHFLIQKYYLDLYCRWNEKKNANNILHLLIGKIKVTANRNKFFHPTQSSEILRGFTESFHHCRIKNNTNVFCSASANLSTSEFYEYAPLDILSHTFTNQINIFLKLITICSFTFFIFHQNGLLKIFLIIRPILNLYLIYSQKKKTSNLKQPNNIYVCILCNAANPNLCSCLFWLTHILSYHLK